MHAAGSLLDSPLFRKGEGGYCGCSYAHGAVRVAVRVLASLFVLSRLVVCFFVQRRNHAVIGSSGLHRCRCPLAVTAWEIPEALQVQQLLLDANFEARKL
eukprot:s2340_g7.t1